MILSSPQVVALRKISGILEFVEAHNQRYRAGIEIYEVEMNLFADLTSEEFSARHLIEFPETVTSKCNGPQAPTDNIPDSIDWT